MSVNLWNSSSGKWENDRLPAVIVVTCKNHENRGKYTCISGMYML